MKAVNELIKVLQQEISALGELRDVMQKKQHSIVTNDQAALRASVSEEEKAVRNVKDLEQQRLAVIAHCIDNIDAKMKSVSLKDVAQSLRGAKTDELDRLEQEMRSLVTHIVYINDQNRVLVNNSMHFINETINILTRNRTQHLVNRTV